MVSSIASAGGAVSLTSGVSGSGSTPVWGGLGDEALTAFETLMWRVEEHSTVRSTCLMVELLAGTPSWPDVIEAHERLVRIVPRLTHRIVTPPGGVAPPRWTSDPGFDLRYHLRRARLPAGGGMAELLESAQQSAMSGFDRARPPWEATLYEGLPHGGSAYLMKVHHSMTDGLGVLALVGILQTPAPEGDLGVHADAGAAPAGGEHGLGPIGALRADVVEKAEAVPAAVRWAGGAVARALRAPAPALMSGVRYGRSLRRVLTPPAAAGSPLLAGRGPNWRYAALDVDFPALRSAAKACGASVNDAYVAALLGGYRRYHVAMGASIEVMPITIPVSLRGGEQARGGNDFAAVRLAAPVGVQDPRERMAILREQVRAARDEPALNYINLLAPLAARLPGLLIGAAGPPMTRGSDLQASNVPGAREPTFLAGTEVTRFYGYPPLPGCPAMITLVTHGQIACVGVNYDAAAFTEGELFVSSLVQGFDEVLALAPAGAPPVRSR